jgi:hypothetical protein
MRQEFTALRVLAAAAVEANPPAFSEWLLEPAADGAHLPDRSVTRRLFEAAKEATERRLAAVSNADLHPESRQWVSGGVAHGLTLRVSGGHLAGAQGGVVLDVSYPTITSGWPWRPAVTC